MNKIINILIAVVWFTNGLLCKVLNVVPRHERIVSEILTETHSRVTTTIIGLLEIGMALWILSGKKKKLNTIAQIIIISIMNTLEFILVPELLLWGKFNALFAFLLIIVIYYNAFHQNNTHHALIKS